MKHTRKLAALGIAAALAVGLSACSNDSSDDGAPVASDAATLTDIIAETSRSDLSERGATRLDDQASEAAMELRKREGYF